MKKLLLLSLIITGCSYTKKDSRSYSYSNTTNVRNVQTSETDQNYVSQYRQAPEPTYYVPKPPNYVVEYNGRVESHTPVIYMPPRQERVYGVRAYYAY